jgi:hypothetical protein
MIADLDTFKTFLDIPETDDSQNEILNIYLNAVDILFNELCDREFDETTYTHEEHNGDGGKRLWLKNIPVTAILQLSTERIAAIKIKNTTSGASRATIDVDVSAQTLTHTLVVGATATTADIDLTDAATDTLAELVTAINALGNGWSAEIDDTDLNGLPSTELLEIMGLNCGVPRRGGDATFKDLDIPGEPLGDGFRVDNAEMGTIYTTRGFWSGVNNIIVSYTAGYTAATMPSDLKLGVLAGAAALYARGEEDGFGASNFNQGTLRVSYAEWLPDYTLKMIEKYTRPAST